jgi:hypothetical protein
VGYYIKKSHTPVLFGPLFTPESPRQTVDKTHQCKHGNSASIASVEGGSLP